MLLNRFTARAATAAAALGLATLAGAGSASAHVSAQPEQAAKGGYAKVAFRVPNERPDAGTVKVKVLLPPEHPLTSVRTKPMPGWTARVEKVRLDRPVTSHGSKITEAVRSITWTADPGVRIDPNEFNEFEVTLGALPENTDQLVMPAVQTYDSGEVVRWDDPPAGEGAGEPEHPAPTLELVGGGHSHGPASGNEPEQAAEQGPDSTTGADNTARWLAGAGLVVGALGVGVGGGALLSSRRNRS